MQIEQQPVQISLLSQAGYCLRRAALIMNEQQWQESSDTAKGRKEHQRVHTRRMERHGDIIQLFEHEVYSKTLGLCGKCDEIECKKSQDGCVLPEIDFPVTLYPVEYKHGKVREELEYDIQLCAQAMCLEEMYHTRIAEGAVFYITSHRRHIVELNEDLRNQVKNTLHQIRQIQTTFRIPKAVYSAKCNKCSLRNICLPKLKTSARNYCKMVKKLAEGDVI